MTMSIPLEEGGRLVKTNEDSIFLHLLSPSAEEAASDLDRLLSLLGKSSLGEDDFADILSSMGLPLNKVNVLEGSLKRNELFKRLHFMCQEAETIAFAQQGSYVANMASSPALQVGEIDGNALRVLYAFHPAYITCRNPMDTALALTDFIKELFQDSVQTSQGNINTGLQKEGAFQLLKVLLRTSLKNLMHEEKSSCDDPDNDDHRDDVTISNAVDELMRSHHSINFLLNVNSEPNISKNNAIVSPIHNQKSDDEELDLEMVSSSLLRYFDPTRTSDGPAPINPKSLFHGTLLDKIFDPFHSTANDFVTAIDTAVLGHDALDHHVLTSFSMGSYGGLPGTVSLLADFMDAYQYFTLTFCAGLTQTLNLIREVDPTGRHVEVLQENMEEEQGIYDDEAVHMIKELGLDATQLQGVNHKDLYVTCCDNLRQLNRIFKGGSSRLTEEQRRHIASPLVSAFEDACDINKGATAATAIAAMYFGSELIVAKMYTKLSAFLLALAKEDKGCPVSKQHLAFFLLHIDMDVDHADKMREIVVSLASDKITRLEMTSVVDAILSARVKFFDRFVEAVFPPTGHGGVDSAKLYNQQSQNWVRKEASCLSDFTECPIVFDFCSPFVRGAHVLDVGCGEGHGARKLVAMGATRVVGLDVNREMIRRANANPSKSSCETYEICDACDIVEKFNQLPATLGLVPGRMLDEGCFDLVVAISLFNHTIISQMKRICEQIFHALKPGGHFVFSVPHTFMLNTHGKGVDRNSATDNKKVSMCEQIFQTLKPGTFMRKARGKNINGNSARDYKETGAFSFCKGDATSESYFSLRDREISGDIRTVDGRDLNTKMLFKSINDYTETMSSVGFDIAKIHEARVLPKHVAANPNFFASVRDRPLHIVFDVIKPKICGDVGRIPKAITWSAFDKANADRIISVTMPKSVSSSLVEFAIATYDKGITEETFSPNDGDVQHLSNVAAFAVSLRTRLLDQTGAVYIASGVDTERLGRNVDASTAIGRAKLAYYILSSFIGKVSDNARGKLFDVVDKDLDTHDDNVLISVSRAKAPWHTDGASADNSYDGVGLLCINPASEGGKLHLSNAAAALGSLKTNIPKFILNELFRPLPRDILENGNGQGVARGDLLQFSRNPNLLKLRVQHNAFPIYEEGGSSQMSQVRFRYMRQWIESGHTKGCVPLSPLLQVAMDALDVSLGAEEVASVTMSSGDIMYCNNMTFAHARDAFTNNIDDSPARHKVRIWLKLQGH